MALTRIVRPRHFAEERTLCHGTCESFYLSSELIEGLCGVCYENNLDRRSQRILSFLNNKPFVQKHRWTAWASTRCKVDAFRMNNLIARWIETGMIEAKTRKLPKGAPGTLYRLADARLRGNATAVDTPLTNE